MNKRTKILLGAGGALALWLLTRRRTDLLIDNSDLGKWAKDRFDTFDYYNEETQTNLKEQEKKDSPNYFGDKSHNAIYDPFYDYSDSPDQLYVINQNEKGFSDYEVGQAFRIRIVPSSLKFLGDIQKFEYEPKPYHSAQYGLACIVEIFNPFKFTNDLTNIAKIKDVYLSDLKMNGISCGNLENLTNHGGIANFLSIENYFNMTDKNGDVVSVKNAILGGHSLFLPQVLSYTPYSRGGQPTVLVSSSDFAYKISSDGRSYTLDSEWLTDVSFCVNFQTSSSSIRKNYCEITVGESPTTYQYSSGSSKSISYQPKHLFKLNTSVEIYDRKNVMEHLLPYKTPPQIADIKNGFVESFRLLQMVEKFPDFGNLDPWKLLY